MKASLALVMSLFLWTNSPVSMAAAKQTLVTYQQGDQSFEGVLFTPAKVKGSTPGILLLHNWLGVSDETKHQAERIAELGYVVFAADIYGKGIRPKTPQEAGQLAGQYKSNRKLFRERILLGLDQLKAQKIVDTKRLLAVGYCFGGTGVIELARTGADLKGVVSFHGGLDSPMPADGKNIRTKVLALHGANDPFVKAEELAAFTAEMRDNNVDWQLVEYGGAVHSFTDKQAGNDPSKGAAYNEKADLRSFVAFKDFAKEVL